MKINMNENEIIVFLTKETIKNINFYDKEELEIYFKELFIKMKEKYSIDFKSFYDINVYLNNYYGAVIHIQEVMIDYFFENQIDMKINVISDCLFLFKINNYYDLKDYKNKIYQYKNNFYIDIDKNVFYFIEKCDIIYGTLAENIKKYGLEVSV